ncbi:hypothetical protein [Egicoccus sp. AB-alg2]|uniref:hypothetical protein n=1 Tax=Egicoccus sp. AB-alg2 TaxID=3242693 RepID=UPI00359F0677
MDPLFGKVLFDTFWDPVPHTRRSPSTSGLRSRRLGAAMRRLVARPLGIARRLPRPPATRPAPCS